MSSIIKVNTYQDANGNALFSSDGSGNVTLTNFPDNTPAFEAYLSANQSISDATLTKVQFNVKLFDTNSAYDNSTNYRFTVPSGQGGKYFVYAQLYMLGNGQNDVNTARIDLDKNGSTYRYQAQGYSGNPVYTQSPTMSATVDLSAGDYIEIRAYLDSGSGTATVKGEADKTSFFGAYKIIGA